ncbi:MAG: tRNA (adenosine(37)-N6)-dimethylallyltransferase MiaA [Clostridiaceae bacterium]|nr:tRNA (adenosine(37)-N6)-dimethylallyltransferase MiaA [Clostridiaceae bacterium]
MDKQPLVILTGPTAVGKTSLSIALAKALNGEIISADSMQVYRHMDIGTAKIMPEQMQGVEHYLIDELEPEEEFNVAFFQKRCKECIRQIAQKGKLPILVGGTGFYIQSVLYDIDFEETNADASYREELEAFAGREGNQALHERLREVDAASADTIHPNNVRRVVRALEYYKQTGHRISDHNKTQREKEAVYDFRYYVLSLPRTILYDRINRRVDQMQKEGLAAEVEGLLRRGCSRSLTSMQGLGYKEMVDAIEGRDTFEHAFDRIKQETKHFAKRQFTWFRRERDVIWLEKEKFDSEDALLAYCIRDCADHFGLSPNQAKNRM